MSLDEKLIFDTAVEIDHPDQRARYLQEVCGADADLRQRIQSLLNATMECGSFLQKRAAESFEGRPQDGEPEPIHQTIGRYKLLEKIGEGGFGDVYMAEQQEPVIRKVALKIIKPGMDSTQVIARFEAERQALALMEHPHIGKFLDAGATDNGRPYFVMELVRGVPVTDYCATHRLSIEERLKLFIEICGAVQHAHQKGIIHRDIKPSNILVATNGDRPVPQVIDFGIAKATQGRLTDKTLFTNFRQFIGTPSYMSPEQAQMSAVDIDTRSDIYSLGVLLYELLTGKTPLDVVDLQTAGYEELCRRIREDEADKPSHRLSSLSLDEVATLATSRRVAPAKLVAELRGDLDLIVMKAVDKDRTRRYATAGALAADLQRHLANEPVEARPPSIAYRLRKAAARNRVAVGTITVIALALIAGTVASSIGLARAWRAQLNLENAQQQLRSQLSATIAARARAEVNLYAAEMNRAAMAYQDNSISLALCLLDRHRQSHGGRFEWRLINHMCRQGDAVHTFSQHTDGVNCVAVSQHGLIASGSSDRTFRLFDIRQKRELGIKTMPREVISVDFTPDGKVLAVADEGNQVTFWNVETLQPIGRLPHDQRLNARGAGVKFLPNPETLAVFTQTTRLQLWNWREPDTIPVELDGAVGTLLSVAQSGNLLALRPKSRPTQFSLWRRVSDRSFERSCDVQTHHLWGLKGVAAFSQPDPTYLATTDRRADIRIWDTDALEKAEITKQPQTPCATFSTKALSLAYTPDGEFLVAAGSNGNVEYWRGLPPWALDERPQRTLRGHTAAINSIECSHDGRWIVTGSKDHTVKVWPGRPPQVGRDALMANDWIYTVRFSPDDRKLAAGGFDGHVLILDVETMEELANQRRHRQQVLDVAFSTSGNWLASCSGQWRYDGTAPAENMGRVSFVNLSDRQKDYYVDQVAAQVRGIDSCPRAELFAFGDFDGTLRIWDVEQRRTRAQVDLKQRVRTVRYSPNGKLLAVVAHRGLQLRHSESLELIATSDGYARGVAFSPDGQLLAYALSGRIQMLSVPELTPVSTLETGANRYSDIAFLPDGKTLAACGMDGRVVLWNLETAHDVVSLRAHRGHATGVAVAHSGNLLASSGVDKLIRIWRASPALPNGSN